MCPRVSRAPCGVRPFKTYPIHTSRPPTVSWFFGHLQGCGYSHAVGQRTLQHVHTHAEAHTHTRRHVYLSFPSIRCVLTWCMMAYCDAAWRSGTGERSVAKKTSCCAGGGGDAAAAPGRRYADQTTTLFPCAPRIHDCSSFSSSSGLFTWRRSVIFVSMPLPGF